MVSTLRTIFVLLLLVQAGCISRKRVVPVAERPLPAQTVSRSDLLRSLEEKSGQIRTLQATVTLDASGGAMKTGVLTEYRETRGFIVVSRPAHIRIKAQAPLALATVFDMVSDGAQYKVSIPLKNKFIIGNNSAPAKEKNPILNLRPQHLLEALFVDIRPYMNNPNVRSILEEASEGRRSFYVFSFVNVAGAQADLLEKLWIDRTDLQVIRKEIFEGDGKLATDVGYSNYSEQQEIPFPQLIVLKRPIEDYTLKVTFEKTNLNMTLAADVFNLQSPEGAEVVRLEADRN